MRNFVKRFWNDDAGFIVSAELLFLYTITVLGLVTGMVAIRNAVVHEMSEVGQSLLALDQSYGFSALSGCKSYTNGSEFIQQTVDLTTVTITGVAPTGTAAVTTTGGLQAACP